MFKKLLTGFVVAALALTGTPIDSSADVEVGDNLKLFGDVRIRLEYDKRSPGTDTDGDGVSSEDSRERPRIRARFGANYQTAIDALSFGIRFTTGSSLNSPHTNFDTALGSVATPTINPNGKILNLDRAFVVLKFLESGALIVGKQAYPLWQQTEQFWDTDISPEGYAAAYTASLGDAGSVTIAGAYYYLLNNGWQDSMFDNDAAAAWQVAWKGNVQDLGVVLAGTGLHTIDGDDSNATPTTQGLTSSEVAFYMISGQVKGKFNDVKWLVGGDYHLSDADIAGTSDDNDNGYVIQGRVNVDQWGVRYYYYDVEENAAPAYAGIPLSQDNFPSGSAVGPVGFDGHRIQLDYRFAKGVSTDFRIYLHESDGADNAWGDGVTSRDRYQLNFNVKF
ncbi:MAG: hypothetical protein CMD96_06130 [Gammaproteobacteria bacterium]|jgi:hypothetical protein|nr:hypothetical protein [Gammaproteobacteria bacterium]HJP17634.1 putative porin [Nitrospinota bacterium]|tara:strand:+ start:93 stop:1268 length:1176 start_codon:yes stop_codon:yes gene_type:complete